METLIKKAQELTTEELKALLDERLLEENQAKNKARLDYEALKEATVLGLSLNASGLSSMLKDFSLKAFNEMESLYDLLCVYSNRHAEGKGNFSLESKDGSLKVVYKRQELGYFDERSVQAEKHIMDFVNSKFSDDDDKELFMTILERKKGNLDIKLVQKLYAMENRFDNPNWKEGIKLLKESWTPSGSKPYITFYVKQKGVWHQINLNFSSIKPL
jgi:hypothetical protein